MYISFRPLLFCIASLLLHISPAIAEPPAAESASPIKFCAQWIRRTGNAVTTVSKFQNTSDKPIFAFKGRLLFHNDFDEVAGKEEWVYSSGLMHIDKNDNRAPHPAIQSKQYIYLMTLEFNDGQQGSSASMEVNPFLQMFKVRTEDELRPAQVKNKITYEPIKAVESKE